MDLAHLRLLVPDDPAAVERLAAALSEQGDPPIALAKDPSTVLSVQCATAALMLRSRVIQALEQAYGPDWPRRAQAARRTADAGSGWATPASAGQAGRSRGCRVRCQAVRPRCP